ncbi:hypothetical protein INR49_009763 [Caranx melampygus]|nr:hypothetical protein INR49_009763 [Caranx melampygus]
MAAGNYVSKLNEYSQRTGYSLRYEDLGSVGLDHVKTFRQRAVLNGIAYPEGVGRNKKDAKQNAAKNALTCLLEDTHHDSADSINAAEAVTAPAQPTSISDINYICWVNEYGQRSKKSIKAVESTRADPDCTVKYCCSFAVGDKEYPTVSANSKREAKEEAAKLVYDVINGSKLQRFSYKVVINNKEYPVGKGRSVKEAKQNAARQAWSALTEQSDWDSEMSCGPTVSEDDTTSSTASSSSQDSAASSSQSQPNSASDSIVFEHSSNPPGAQEPSCSERDAPAVDQVVKNKKISNTSVPPRFTSEFDSIEPLGKGGFGCVYKARRILLDKYHAVKIVRGNKKALREVRALSDLQHENIVRYYDCWMEHSEYKHPSSKHRYASANNSECLYIMMELCDKTLRAWINETNMKSVDASKRRESSLMIAQQIVSGVEYIHSSKLIHRDLKPDNIMFGQDRKVKIGDFGLVTAEADDDDKNLLERTNRGTRSYMAPEQKRMIKSMLREKPEDRPEASQLKAKLDQLAQTPMRQQNINAAEAVTAPAQPTSISDINYIGWVNEYGHSSKQSIQALESARVDPDLTVKYCCRFVVGGKEYPLASHPVTGKVKEEAAKLVYDVINSSKTTEITDENHSSTKTKGPNLNSKDKSSTETNFIGLINNLCQKEKWSHEFMMVEIHGPSHDPEFTSDFDSIEPLGKGGFGCVYKARRIFLNEYRAVKIVRGNEKALREVKALSKLQHQNIVRYYDCWMEHSEYKHPSSKQRSGCANNSECLYIMMELCDKTLRAWINETNMKSVDASKRRESSLMIAQQIVSGVEYIHSSKLIHRDLKPENIMFGQDGKVKIGDFGLVTAEADNDDKDLMEMTNRGTRCYMAPEHKRMIKSMLREKPEDRPEASELKAKLDQLTQTPMRQQHVTF